VALAVRDDGKKASPASGSWRAPERARLWGKERGKVNQQKHLIHCRRFGPETGAKRGYLPR